MMGSVRLFDDAAQDIGDQNLKADKPGDRENDDVNHDLLHELLADRDFGPCDWPRKPA